MRDGNYPNLLNTSLFSLTIVLEVTMRDGNTNLKRFYKFSHTYPVLEVTMRDGNLFQIGIIIIQNDKKSFRSDYEGWKLIDYYRVPVPLVGDVLEVTMRDGNLPELLE